MTAKDFAVDAIVAGTTASAATTIMAPFRNHMLILHQYQFDPKSSTRISTIEAIKRVGFNFWNGNMQSSVRYGMSTAIQFGVFQYGTRTLEKVFKKEELGLKSLGNILVGGLAGISSLPIMHPIYRQNVPFKMPTGSTVPGWARFFHYYDGFQEAVVPALVHKGLYFGLYYSLKPILIQDPNHSPFKSLILATATSYTALAVSSPFNYIQRRTVTIDSSIRPRGWRVAKEIITKEGFRTLFKTPISLSSAVTGALVLVGFDQLRAATQSRKKQE